MLTDAEIRARAKVVEFFRLWPGGRALPVAIQSWALRGLKDPATNRDLWTAARTRAFLDAMVADGVLERCVYRDIDGRRGFGPRTVQGYRLTTALEVRSARK
jgi:hypothetical protein